MYIFKHPRNASYSIWAYDIFNILIKETYFGYNQKECIKLFRSKHPNRKTKGITKTDYCPFLFN